MSADSQHPSFDNLASVGARLLGKLSLRVKIDPTNKVCFSAITPKRKSAARDSDFDADSFLAESGAKPLLVNSAELHRDNSGTEKSERVGWGGLSRSVGVSWKTRRQILNRAAAIEREYGIKNIRFCTLTLPASTPEAFEALARYSARIVDIFGKKFDRLLGKNHARLWVWEYQKRGALHAHIIVGSQDGTIERLTTNEIKSHWVKVLGDLSDELGIDLFKKNSSWSWRNDTDKVRADSQEVKKSVSAYLGKYLSKSVSKIKQNNGRFFAPSRWAVWNRKASECLAKHTYSEIIAALNPNEWTEVKQWVKDALDAIKIEGTKVIDTAESGKINDCIYALVDGSSDCMDAIKAVGQSITDTYGKLKMKFSFMKENEVQAYYEKQARIEMGRERKQQKHDANIAHIATHGKPKLSRSDCGISRGEQLDGWAAMNAEVYYRKMGESKPIVTIEKSQGSWNSCDGNGLVMHQGNGLKKPSHAVSE
jgi:hypothetical protein